MSLVIYGPQGCGKTRNALRLAAHFGLSHIIDEWQPGDLLPPDTLALTSAESVPGGIAFPAAMAELNMPSAEAKRRSTFPHCPWPSCRGTLIRAPYAQHPVACACLAAALEPGPAETGAIRSFFERNQARFLAPYPPGREDLRTTRVATSLRKLGYCVRSPQSTDRAASQPLSPQLLPRARALLKTLSLVALGALLGWLATKL
jgi:hypothetical protein